jgi:hypothetical protein
MRWGQKGERLLGVFFLGALLFNPPLLGLFGVPRTILGVPVLYVYVFAAWLGVIVLAALAAGQRRERAPGEEN